MGADGFCGLAREEYEEALQADEEEAVSDEEKILNLDEEDGEVSFLLLVFSLAHILHNAEDVWDEDSAYLEMLANEVSESDSRLHVTG